MSDASPRLCEVCAEALPADQNVTLLGSCEFPFSVHEQCQPSMQPVASFVGELCARSDEQPDGLLDLGGWDGRPSPLEEAAVDPAVTAYLAGEPLPAGRLGRENGALYLDGWQPLAVALDGAHLVRQDDGPAEVRRTLAARLGDRGLRPQPADDRLLESVSLQRLGLLNARWEVWAADPEVARQAVAGACIG